MKKAMRTVLVVTTFLFLSVVFSALSCSITPTSTGCVLTLKNDQGAGITVWLRIYTAPGIYETPGPYANGTQEDFEVFSGYQVRVWDGTHGEFLSFDTGGTIYTITRNTLLYIMPGVTPYVSVAIW
jgi:hypothetical protein